MPDRSPSPTFGSPPAQGSGASACRRGRDHLADGPEHQRRRGDPLDHDVDASGEAVPEPGMISSSTRTASSRTSDATVATSARRLPYWIHGNPSSRTRAPCPGRSRPSASAGANSATTWSPPSGTSVPTRSPSASTDPTWRGATSPRRPLAGARTTCRSTSTARVSISASVADSVPSRRASRRRSSSSRTRVWDSRVR